MRFLVYEVMIFGTYNKGKGLTSMYTQMFPTPGLVALYLYYPCAETERTYVLIWLYKFVTILLWSTVISYGIDLFMFYYDTHLFCAL